jgi:hypothetical protein
MPHLPRERRGMSLLSTTVYKPCESKCGSCKPCKSFARVVAEIDLKHRSRHDRERSSLDATRRLLIEASSR